MSSAESAFAIGDMMAFIRSDETKSRICCSRYGADWPSILGNAPVESEVPSKAWHAAQAGAPAVPCATITAPRLASAGRLLSCARTETGQGKQRTVIQTIITAALSCLVRVICAPTVLAGRLCALTAI